jgi:hypothetical protein
MCRSVVSARTIETQNFREAAEISSARIQECKLRSSSPIPSQLWYAIFHKSEMEVEDILLVETYPITHTTIEMKARLFYPVLEPIKIMRLLGIGPQCDTKEHYYERS